MVSACETLDALNSAYKTTKTLFVVKHLSMSESEGDDDDGYEPDNDGALRLLRITSTANNYVCLIADTLPSMMLFLN